MTDTQEVKPCPLCGRETHRKYLHDPIVHCRNSKCALSGTVFTIKEWNSRPTEEALRAEIDALIHDNRTLMDSLNSCEARVGELMMALKDLEMAAQSFQSAILATTGHPYPWEPLDIAYKKAAEVLAKQGSVQE